MLGFLSFMNGLNFEEPLGGQKLFVDPYRPSKIYQDSTGENRLFEPRKLV